MYPGAARNRRKANNISPSAKFDRLEVEDWTRGGFFVHYNNRQTAEVSWSFVRELPPKEFTRRGGPKNSKK